MWRLFLAVLIVIGVLGDIASKEWALSHQTRWYATALAFYLANSFLWLYIVSQAGLARGGAIYSVACMALAYLIGVGLYGETLTMQQNVGAGLGVVALALLL